MREFIFDIESDGLLDTITKIHCVSYSQADGQFSGTIYSEEDIKNFFSHDYLYIGHHVIGYDIKALLKIYNIPKPKHIVDTLALSWYLYPERAEHGLESWGEDFKVPKPKIDDWQNLTIEEYTHRCETDVEINRLLWNKCKNRLQELYS